MAGDFIRIAGGVFCTGRNTIAGRIPHLLGFGFGPKLLSSLDQYYICTQHAGIGIRRAAFVGSINKKCWRGIDLGPRRAFLPVLDPGFKFPFDIDRILSPVVIQLDAFYL